MMAHPMERTAGATPAAARRLRRVTGHVVPSSSSAASPAEQPAPPTQEQGVGGSEAFGYWPESLLLHKGTRRDAVLAEWRRRRPAAAAAMYPAGMGHTREEMPVLWNQHEWAEAEATQRAEPIFDAAEYEAQMAAQRDSFERDGYIVLRGAMTAAATEQWCAALRRCQELNDNLVRCNWESGIDWRGLGWTEDASPQPPTAEMIETATGSGQRFKPQTAENGILLLRQHSVMPEYCPAAHSGYLMRCLFHPDLLDLHRRCLGTSDVFLDNTQLNNKAAPQSGGPWHSHGTGVAGSGLYGERCDDVGACTDPAEYMAQPCINVMLVYPDGLAEKDGGTISIIRGSHFFRDVTACSAGSGAAGDAELAAGWMKGKTHPLTGEPLRTERLSLPRGSVVCCNTHAAHMVNPKPPGTRQRLACSWFFKKRSDRSGMTSAPYAVPPILALRAAEGELPKGLAAVLRNTYDPSLTDGSTAH
jgi:hypothetical protein